MNNIRVPFLDLKAQHDPIRAELLHAFEQVLDTSAFAGGKFVDAFEKDFASYCGVSHAVGVGNGTDALWLALLALGVGPSDEVVTVAATFMATAEAITYTGATPVFVDIDPATYTLDPKLLERAITPRTKAIIPVHLYGQMADMDPILAIARQHRLPVIEDACQAHGATYKGRPAGSLGEAAAFSFYPGKNLGALGEAGGLTTQNEQIATIARQLRDHGQVAKYRHARIGWNARMDGIQGAALQLKLRNLTRGNEARRARANRYNQLLAGLPGIETPVFSERGLSSHHLYVIRSPKRDALLEQMARRGVGCALHYPIPVHLQAAYAHLGYKPGSLPVTEQLAAECLSLPLYPELSWENHHVVVEALKSVVAELSSDRLPAAAVA